MSSLNELDAPQGLAMTTVAGAGAVTDALPASQTGTAGELVPTRVATRLEHCSWWQLKHRPGRSGRHPGARGLPYLPSLRAGAATRFLRVLPVDEVVARKLTGV